MESLLPLLGCLQALIWKFSVERRHQLAAATVNKLRSIEVTKDNRMQKKPLSSIPKQKAPSSSKQAGQSIEKTR